MIFCKAIPLKDLRSCPGEVVVLFPSDADAEEKLRKVRGKEFGVKTHRGRSIQQHRLFFAALRRVWENQERYPSEDALRSATLIAIGFAEPLQLFNGYIIWEPRSMDFRLSQDEFQEKVFDPSVTLWCQEFGWDPVELLRG